MATAITLSQYLSDARLPYELIAHPHTHSSLQTARAAHISPQQLVKGVLLDEHGSLLLAILPAARHLHLGALRRKLHRDLGMATETAVRHVFGDCEPGAVPVPGGAYGIETVWDDSLMNSTDLYFEAGDHETLVHLRTEDFLELVRECQHGEFSIKV